MTFPNTMSDCESSAFVIKKSQAGKSIESSLSRVRLLLVLSPNLANYLSSHRL